MDFLLDCNDVFSDEVEAQPAHDQWPSEGQILARASTRSLFAKDWVSMYWVIDDHDLYLYKSKMDYDLNMRGSGFKKRIPIAYNLRCLKIHRKDYSGIGSLLNFMLEEVLDYGPSNVAKFASPNSDSIEALYEQLKRRILQKRRERGV